MANTLNTCFTNYLYCKTVVIKDCVLNVRNTTRFSLQIRPITIFYEYQPVSVVLIDVAPSIQRVTFFIKIKLASRHLLLYVVYRYKKS